MDVSCAGPPRLVAMNGLWSGHRVIEAPELSNLMADGADMVLLDVRACHASGHLPGAFGVDPAAWATLERTDLQEALRTLGVDDTTPVVAYGDHKGLDAGRLAWLLEQAGHRSTALLDGGFDAWWRLGLPTTSDLGSQARRGGLTWGDPLTLTCTTQEAAGFAARRQLVDVRTRSRFKAGAEGGAEGGAIPGAVNVPATAFGDQAGRVLDPASMALRLRRAGVDPRQPFVAHCDGGPASAWVAYVARRAGFDVRVHVTD